MGVQAAAIETFRRSFAGEVILPSDDQYEAARRVWNGMIDRRPAIVVRPTSRDDVTTAIRFGQDQGLVMAVRSGGHSLPGHSTCDGGIVIDMSMHHGATVDPQQRVAVVLGGSLLGELDDAAQEHGLVCPVGVVSHTGVAGLTLGGGMGRLQRKHGFTIDNLRRVELVTADGRFVGASETENPDLFWALRGAGANFGIATSFEFDLHPQDPVITRGWLAYPVERAREVWAFFRDVGTAAPDHVMTSLSIGLAVPADDWPASVAGQPVAVIGVTHSGDPAEAERDLAPLMALGPPVAGEIGPQRYLDVQRAADEASGWGHRVYMKAGFVDDVPDAVIVAIVEHAIRAPGENQLSVATLGGALARVDEDATAFMGRSARFEMSAEAVWDDPALDERHVTWVRELAAVFQPYTVAGRYVNDVAESGVDLAGSIYGEAKLARLRAVKRAWDPDNVFRLNQNIAP